MPSRKFSAQEQLATRPSRAPDHPAEQDATAALIDAIAGTEDDPLQRVAEAALQLCRAQTAGISTPGSDGERALLQWSAVVGTWAASRGRIVALEASPSKIVMLDDSAVLVSQPEQHFHPAGDLVPPATELLMVPFHLHGAPAGTIWVIQHDPSRQFEQEDLRLLNRMARLAALAWQARREQRQDPTSDRRSFRLRRASDENVERLKLALIAGKMATWYWDPATDAVTASETMGALYGVRPGEKWDSGAYGISLIHPEDRDRHSAMVQRGLSDAGGWHGEYRIIRPIDGQVAWLEERAHMVQNPVTGRTEMTGLVWDITQRKNAELALRASEMRISASQAELDRLQRLYESILNNTPDLAYVWDLRHRFIYANEGLLRMWGKTWDEAIGRTCLELGYEPWHAAMHDREIDQIAATGKPMRGQVPFNGTFGRRIYDYIMVPVFNAQGEVEAVAGTTRDVTESKQIEEMLRNHAQQIETLLNAAPLGVFMLDSGFRIRSLNDIARAAFGDQADIIGRDFEEMMQVLWSPTYAAEVIRLYRRTMETGESYVTPERGEFRADRGITEYYEWRIDRIVLPDGKFGLVCYFRDISQQVQARKIIEQSRQTLKDVDRRKDEFLAVLAHELRNPLAPIRHGLQIVQRSTDPVALASAAQMMSRQLSQLVRLVDDLLDISRISSGRIELRRQPTELAEVISQAAETIRPICDDLKHELTIALPEQPVWLDGDPARLIQTFANLLSNACRYMENGGRIWISTTLIPADGLSGPEVEVRVRDTGIGIAPDQLRSIFEMFTQGNSSLERSQGGLGIGLTLVQSLLGLHGGRVTAHSDGQGQGSEFVVRLPVMRDVPAPAMPAATPPKPAGSDTPHRILVVDDNTDSADSLATLLSLLGHETTTAYDGMKAIEVARAFKPDVVLLDLGMPRMNGYDTCRLLRADPGGQDIMIVAQSGWGSAEDKRRSAEAGFDGHLVKPVDHEVLIRALGTLRRRK